MKTKHTKGEWTLPHFITSETCTCGYIYGNLDGDGVVIGEVFFKPDKDDPNNRISDENPPLEEAIANAKLICAAQDMLDALDSILSTHEDNGREGCTWGDTDFDSLSVAFGYNQCLEHMREIAEKAINKATK